MVLGTWQGIYLFEHRDRAHDRKVVIHLSRWVLASPKRDNVFIIRKINGLHAIIKKAPSSLNNEAFLDVTVQFFGAKSFEQLSQK
jgi:hypothetical protein